MIHDRLLRLTNEVFRFGLQACKCTIRTVMDNNKLKDTPVRAHLRAIDKIIKPYRETRNSIAHSLRYTDLCLAKMEPFYLLEKVGGIADKELLDKARNLYKCDADAYTKEKCQEFGTLVDELICEVECFFESLLHPFELNYMAFK